ncbi:MAG: hypothetical protein KIS78_12160 [Labilithrix sp.]|nr:hypothetical protein [Labilithrix sp.]
MLRSFGFTVICGGLAVLSACSSDPAPAAGCDSAKCAPGNTCLPFEGETKCRKTCSSNADPATSCPFGYTCTDTQTGDEPFCVQDTAIGFDGQPLQPKTSGQWGAKCQANLGMENPGCDTDQGFYCYGVSPTDGDAYCTRYDCQTDRDCGAGFWCGQANLTPNVGTAKRSTFGEVQNVCLRRTYCSTCKVDLDCPPILGKVQHCIDDASGARVCAPECDGNASCPNEARCADVGVGAKVCYPRATVCVGDGSLCSPCRVDTDCGEDGVCVKGQYTTEKACAKKSTKSCGTSSAPSQGSCPQSLPDGSKAAVRCLGAVFDEVPEDYCHGIYMIGAEGGDIGCWTPKR